MLSPVLMRAILDGYLLPVMGIHGLPHWGRVFETGLRPAEITGADLEVVALFAVFHDSRRVNEGTDPDQGPRGAELAERHAWVYLILAGTASNPVVPTREPEAPRPKGPGAFFCSTVMIRVAPMVCPGVIPQRRTGIGHKLQEGHAVPAEGLRRSRAFETASVLSLSGYSMTMTSFWVLWRHSLTPVSVTR